MSEPGLRYLDLPSGDSRIERGLRGEQINTDGRRWLQLGLATAWLIAGVLQLQPFMFTRSFATEVLVPSANGNPAWVSASILWAARITESYPVWTNAVFATVQLLLGIAIAVRPLVTWGLGASVLWAVLVWWFGEGLGGILVPGASGLTGAPGAAILYALLAVLVWPSSASRPSAFIGAGSIGPRAAKTLWVLLWGGMAALDLEPSNLQSGSLSRSVDGTGAGQPHWLDALVTGFTGLSAQAGVAFTITGALVLAGVAIGIVLPPPAVRVSIAIAVAASAFIWVFGEALGDLFGGQATDVGSGPLLALIALAYWPARVRPATP